MGIMADAALAAGGRCSVIRFLTRREVAHETVTEMVVTDSMHSRKQRMFAAADAFISPCPAVSARWTGTIEITWRQLRLHDKPV